jgi:predicted transposase/invertase (TIGR01784 family)
MKTSFLETLRLNAELRRQARLNAEQGKPLPLTLDIVFKALFAGNSKESENALRFLLSDCIHRPVSALSIRNSEIIPEYLSGKTVRLDVHASFNDGEEADIEMQAGKSSDSLKTRALFYASRLLSGQEQRGKRYGEIKRVYQIFFLNDILFPGSEKLPRRYTVQEETEHDQLSEVMKIIFYELPKLEKRVKGYTEGAKVHLSAEEKWCIYFRYKANEKMGALIEDLIREEEGIMWAELALKKMNWDKERWARALWREKRAMDYQDWQLGLKQAREEAKKEGRAEGKAEGIAEGKAEGRAEGKAEGIVIGEAKGIAEGKAEGRAEGIAEGEVKGEERGGQKKAREIARKALAKGATDDFVREITGLDTKTIRELSRKR